MTLSMECAMSTSRNHAARTLAGSRGRKRTGDGRGILLLLLLLQPSFLALRECGVIGAIVLGAVTDPTLATTVLDHLAPATLCQVVWRHHTEI